MIQADYERSLSECQPPPSRSCSGQSGNNGGEIRGTLSSSIIEDDDDAAATVGASSSTDKPIATTAAAAVAPPHKSIQEIRRERLAGVPPGAAPSSHASNFPPPPPAPHGLRIKGLASRVRSTLNSGPGGYGSLSRLERDFTNVSLRQTCTYLDASAEDLRLADVAGLLDEYRDLALLANDLMTAICGGAAGGGGRGQLSRTSSLNKTSRTALSGASALGDTSQSMTTSYGSNSSISLSASGAASSTNIEAPDARAGGGKNGRWG